MRFHTQTAGVSLTAQQPLLNVVRTTIEALAGVLGGTQSLHTNSYDEALALPTEDAARLALRTQQIIAFETGVANTVDPLGGAYFIEALTDQMERGARTYFDAIDRQGGMVAAVKNNYPQREIAEAAYVLQAEIEAGERTVVGVNRFVQFDEEQGELHRTDPRLEQKQIEQLRADRAARDETVVTGAIEQVRATATDPAQNLMPSLITAARAGASEGELVAALQTVFGSYTETPVF